MIKRTGLIHEEKKESNKINTHELKNQRNKKEKEKNRRRSKVDT
jgi:hypothetical protein